MASYTFWGSICSVESSREARAEEEWSDVERWTMFAAELVTEWRSKAARTCRACRPITDVAVPKRGVVCVLLPRLPELLVHERSCETGCGEDGGIMGSDRGGSLGKPPSGKLMLLGVLVLWTVDGCVLINNAVLPSLAPLSGAVRSSSNVGIAS